MRRSAWHAALPNGLTVLGEHVPGSGLVALRLRAAVGARHQKPNEQGAAHFLEHTTVQASSGKLQAAFGALGAELNANTSPEETCFFTYLLPDYLPQALPLLANMLVPPHETTCSNERQVIGQEIQRAYGAPSVALYKHLLATLFPNHPIGSDVLGTMASLASLTSSHLADLARRRYCSKHLTVAIAGECEQEVIVPLVQDCTWPENATEIELEEPPPQACSGARWVYEPALKQLYLGMGIAGPGLDVGCEYYVLPILAIILAGRLNARLQALAVPAHASAFYVPFEDCGFMFLMLVLQAARANEGIQALNETLTSLDTDSARDGEWTVARMQQAIRLAAESENMSLAARNLIGRWLICRRPMTSIEEVSLVLALEHAGIQRAWSRLSSSSRCCVSLGDASRQALPELETLIRPGR